MRLSCSAASTPSATSAGPVPTVTVVAAETTNGAPSASRTSRGAGTSRRGVVGAGTTVLPGGGSEHGRATARPPRTSVPGSSVPVGRRAGRVLRAGRGVRSRAGTRGPSGGLFAAPGGAGRRRAGCRAARVAAPPGLPRRAGCRAARVAAPPGLPGVEGSDGHAVGVSVRTFHCRGCRGWARARAVRPRVTGRTRAGHGTDAAGAGGQRSGICAGDGPPRPPRRPYGPGHADTRDGPRPHHRPRDGDGRDASARRARTGRAAPRGVQRRRGRRRLDGGPPAGRLGAGRRRGGGRRRWRGWRGRGRGGRRRRVGRG